MPRAIDNVRRFRMELAEALIEWRDAGGHVEDITDRIEALISAKIDIALQPIERRTAPTSSEQHK